MKIKKNALVADSITFVALKPRKGMARITICLRMVDVCRKHPCSIIFQIEASKILKLLKEKPQDAKKVRNREFCSFKGKCENKRLVKAIYSKQYGLHYVLCTWLLTCNHKTFTPVMVIVLE